MMRKPWKRREKARTDRRVAGDQKILGMTRVQVGIVSVILTLAAGWAMFSKARIMTALRPGTHVSAEFTEQYKLVPYASKVKIAGVPVGLVTGIDPTEDGVLVDMKVDGDAREALGSEPSAVIRPVTLLGGGSISVYVELIPGGDPGTFEGSIPIERTSLPVELDRVLEVLTDEPLSGLRTSVYELDETLGNGGAGALGALLDGAPDALVPAGEVLDALRGADGDDLSDVVVGLEALAARLAESEDRTDALLTGIDSLAGTLQRHSGALRQAVATLPSALTHTRGTLVGLDEALDRLERVAAPLVPAVDALTAALRVAAPVLAEARPLAVDARPMVADLSAVLDQLVPIVSDGTQIVRDVSGPVIERIRNPIISTLNAPFRDSPDLLYQELAYMLTGLDGIAKITDFNGAAINFNPGLNEETIGGLPLQSPLSNHNDPKGEG
jgi:phospholipid/cholesterol/gamma-HCH transport system substrate-binding protein